MPKQRSLSDLKVNVYIITMKSSWEMHQPLPRLVTAFYKMYGCKTSWIVRTELYMISFFSLLIWKLNVVLYSGVLLWWWACMDSEHIGHFIWERPLLICFVTMPCPPYLLNVSSASPSIQPVPLHAPSLTCLNYASETLPFYWWRPHNLADKMTRAVDLVMELGQETIFPYPIAFSFHQQMYAMGREQEREVDMWGKGGLGWKDRQVSF